MAAFLSLGLPSKSLKTGVGRRWLGRFMDGFRTIADHNSVVLAGGDTGEMTSGGMVADIVLVGQVPRGTELRRSGARVGDGIYVTGALGGAAAELERMMAGGGRRARRTGVAGTQPQSYPEPRLAVGRALRRRGIATACIDVSDGLSTDLRHLCESSGVGAEVSEGALPVHRLAEGPDRLRLALDGGEDYELLFTASGRVPGKIAGVAVTRVGEVVRRRGMVLVGIDGSRSELKAGGWEHFRG